MLWQILLVILIGTWITINRFIKRKILKFASEIPKLSVKWYPFVGQAHIMLGSDEDRMKAFQKLGLEANANGGLISFWFGRNFYIVLSDAEIANQVLKSCLQKDDLMKYIQDLTGNGHIFADKHIWRPRRKVMAPAFGPKFLNSITEVFTKQSKILANNLEEVCGKEDFSIFQYMTKYAMDAVFQTNLGMNLAVQSNPNHPFIRALYIANEVLGARVCQPWLQYDFVYRLTSKYRIMENVVKKQLFGLIEQVIKEKRKEFQENTKLKSSKHTISSNNKIPTLMEILLENAGHKGGYTDLELREELLVLVIAGTDTSANGSSFTMLMLAKHEDVQEKLFKELHEVFGDSDRPLTNEDFPKLKYLDAVVRESLRLYPPIPIITRKVEEDVTLPTGVQLFPGIGVLINIWALHRNPKYWGQDAEVFRPERFLEEKLPHPAAFMPFSYGPRNCIGFNYALISMKVVISTIIRRYQVLPALSTNNFSPHFVDGKKAKEMAEVKFDIMMKDSCNYMLRLQSRK